MEFEAKKDCKWCSGRGWFYIPNGEDDVDKEICECVVWNKIDGDRKTT